MARETDLLNGITTNYTYDLSGRVTEYYNPLGRLSYGYDNQDRTSQVTLAFNDETFTTSFGYLSANRPGITTLPVGKIDRTYDSLQRETVHQVYATTDAANHLRSETTFLDLAGNRTTELVYNYGLYVGTNSTDKLPVAGYTSFDYNYDVNGNISSITESNGTQTRTKTYVYDTLNQLIRENDGAQGKTFTYTYDNGGNLLSKSEYAYTTGELGEALQTIVYGYTDATWKDKLTSYNGQNITYDAIGNPLTYYNGFTFQWTQGRRLSGTTLADGTNVSYQYNPDGIRISKMVGTTQTVYFTDASGTTQALKQGDETLIFLYDATGRREGFLHYTGETSNGAYYYLYNAQGDVIGIVDSNFIPVVTYEYDSWGNPLSVSGTEAESVGAINPFRYRGYVYDEETGFYLTGTRYYDPEIGRFINADSVISGTGESVQGYNLFAYCFNNPVNMNDPTGNWPLNAISKFVKRVVRGIIVSTIVNHIVNAKNKNKINKEVQEKYTKESAKKEIDKILGDYGDDVSATFNDTGVEITNSVKVKSRYDRQKISTIITRTEDVTKREFDDISAEWLFHNIAYDLHIKRNSAISANLDYSSDSRWYVVGATDLLEIFGWE